MTLTEKNLYIPEMCEICFIEEHSQNEKLFRLRYPDNRSCEHSPGQFMEVSIFGKGEAPISICSSPTRGPEFELTVRKTGSLTKELHQFRSGDMVGIRGPYGRGFNTDEAKNKDILIIAGGIGILPLRGLIQYIVDNRSDYQEVTILYGSKSPSEILFLNELEEWKKADIKIEITVDFAGNKKWEGNVGLITTLLGPAKIDTDNTFAYIVGPPVMYRFVIQELDKKKFPHNRIVLSLERYMKCGVGKCGHCAIGNLYCCTDGPVFRYEDLVGIQEAFG